MAKDTVARAPLRLRRAQLVAPRQTRCGGTFAAGTYDLTIPHGVTVDEAHAANLRASSTNSTASPVHDQLTLAIEA